MSFQEDLDRLQAQRKAAFTQRQAVNAQGERDHLAELAIEARKKAESDAQAEINRVITNEILKPQMFELASELNKHRQPEDISWELVPVEGNGPDTNDEDDTSACNVHYLGFALRREHAGQRLKLFAESGLYYLLHPENHTTYDVIFGGLIEKTRDGESCDRDVQVSSTFLAIRYHRDGHFYIPTYSLDCDKLTGPSIITTPESLREDVISVRNQNSDLHSSLVSHYHQDLVTAVRKFF